MKKSELKTGMRVETSGNLDGLYIVYSEGELFISDGGYMNYGQYNDDLKTLNSNKRLEETADYDIVRVYGIPSLKGFLFNYESKGELLWERKEEQPVVFTDLDKLSTYVHLQIHQLKEEIKNLKQ